jgi:hypothetical protein
MSVATFRAPAADFVYTYQRLCWTWKSFYEVLLALLSNGFECHKAKKLLLLVIEDVLLSVPGFSCSSNNYSGKWMLSCNSHKFTENSHYNLYTV